MNRNRLIIVWILGMCILGGCSYFSLKGGKAQFIIPFDFPQKQDNNQTLSTP